MHCFKACMKKNYDMSKTEIPILQHSPPSWQKGHQKGNESASLVFRGLENSRAQENLSD